MFSERDHLRRSKGEESPTTLRQEGQAASSPEKTTNKSAFIVGRLVDRFSLLLKCCDFDLFKRALVKYCFD